MITVHEGTVATVLFDRPAKLNALGRADMAAFVAAFDSLAAKPELRAIVLTGAGSRAFLGGADITEMASLDSPAAARAFITALHECCEAIRRAPVPVLARIGGYCFGAGLELAASCDLRIAADTATFGMPEVRLGIPSVIEAALLPGLVGWGRARQIVLLGERFGAAEAERWGLAERVVPVAELDVAVDEWLEQILQSPPAAIRAQKALMRRWERLDIDAAIQAGIDSFAAAFETSGPQDAMGAFLHRAR